MAYIIENGDNLEVSVVNFESLFTLADYKIVIPEYQRPYVWSAAKVTELLHDLKAFFKKENPLNYYMGTLLFHQNDKQEAKLDDGKRPLSIIDGQQRISTLLLLYFAIHAEEKYKSLTYSANLEYNSPLSKQSLRNNHQIITAWEHINDLKEVENLFSRLTFTVIVTKSEDDAFTFFETSNNRGVKLSPTAFLKAYHLREIDNKHEELQRTCARRWEKIERLKNSISGSRDFIDVLFNTFLWRSRKWRGSNIEFENQDYLLQEFQKNAISAKSIDKIELYPNRSNMLATHLQLENDMGFRLHGSTIAFQGRSSDFPFLMRQPISKGLNFFLYAEKYAELVHELFNGHRHKDAQIQQVQKLYSEVYKHISVYLKEVFVLCISMYYDKFHTHKIVEFAHKLDYAIGAVRIEKKYIFKQAALKFFRDSNLNLLDVIDQAYISEEVLSFFENNVDIDKMYQVDYAAMKNGVQKRYLESVLTYYSKAEHELKNRKTW